jgi:hypothetical protein
MLYPVELRGLNHLHQLIAFSFTVFSPNTASPDSFCWSISFGFVTMQSSSFPTATFKSVSLTILYR